jgi:hypothetical protein
MLMAGRNAADMGSVIYDEGVEIPLLGDSGVVSDGYHTFDELYRFRMLYNALAFRALVFEPSAMPHKSRFHSDGEPCFGGGWFIVVAYLHGKQISNHYEEADWDLFDIEERIRADKWDGHTPEDVAQRIEEYLRGK